MLGDLRDDLDHGCLFKVRGRHSMVYDVELPHLLPRDILEKMIKRFRHYIHVQLQDMQAPDMGGFAHSCNTSLHSDSGMSIPSVTTVDAAVVQDDVRQMRE
jgi:hypothetical protein